MKPLHVVKEEVLGQKRTRFGNRLILVKIDLLVFNRPPESLNKNIIEYPTSAIHADPDTSLFQPTGKLQAGKLAALIGVENPRL